MDCEKHMSRYRRTFFPGGCYFFTLVTYHRLPWFSHAKNIERLRQGFRRTQSKHPFEIDAIVVLPDHLHMVMQLPVNEYDFSLRIRLIKHYVSTGIDTSTNHKQEKKVWQKRYWEHLIRGQEDWRRHVDYIHYNPVKHRYVNNPAEWPYSSFQRALNRGWYEPDWGNAVPPGIKNLELE